MGDVTDMRDDVKAKAKQLGGDIKRTVGDMAGDKQLQAEGELDRVKGKAEASVVEGKRKLRELGDE